MIIVKGTVGVKAVILCRCRCKALEEVGKTDAQSLDSDYSSYCGPKTWTMPPRPNLKALMLLYGKTKS